jgi:hypothetical protein
VGEVEIIILKEVIWEKEEQNKDIKFILSSKCFVPIL